MRRSIIALLAVGALACGTAAQGTDVRAVPTCGGKPATHIGTVGSDRIVGTNGADVIVGKAGHDTIRGRGGPDLICAGPGDDVVFGGDGSNRIWGEDGDDTLIGGPHYDKMFGGPGNDVLKPGLGNTARLLGNEDHDRFVITTGTDVIANGGRGRDTLDFRQAVTPVVVRLDFTNQEFYLGTAHAGNGPRIERIFGTSGNDVLNGNDAHNVIRGYAGNDLIYGQGGDDRLYGDLGSDNLYGHAGDDELHGGTDLGGGDNDSLDGGILGYDGCGGGESNVNCEYIIYHTF